MTVQPTITGWQTSPGRPFTPSNAPQSRLNKRPAWVRKERRRGLRSGSGHLPLSHPGRAQASRHTSTPCRLAASSLYSASAKSCSCGSWC